MSEFGTETLSPGEAEYFNSGGQVAAALEAELGSKDPAQVAAQVAPEGDSSGQHSGQTAEGSERAAQDRAQVAQGRDDKGRFVPVQALHEERDRRRALEGEVSKLREGFARADERQRALNELLGLDPTAPKAAQAQALIDPEQDIFGAFKQLQQRYDALTTQTKQVDQRITNQTEDQALLSAYQSDARTFAGKTADFGDAYNHLLSTRSQELEALGITDAKERGRIMAAEEKQIAAQSLKAGRSAAETIYNLAKLRGYAGKQVASTASVPNDAARQLEAAQKGREAFPTLSGTGASAPAGLTIEALADMSEADFERTMSKLSESDQRKLMGG